MDEIKIYHASIETPLVLSPERVQLLIVENPHEFYEFVKMLDGQFCGEEGDFRFLHDDKEISPEKEGCMICDSFHFDLNDKKVVNLLYKHLSEHCRYGELQLKLSRIDGIVSQFFFELFSSFPFTLTFDELTVEALLKNGNVRFEKTYNSLIEKVICYINAVSSLKNCRFFVFVNLKSVLNDDELHSLYHHCALEKIGLLLLESNKIRPVLEEEKAVIITEDLCEIVENYEKM